MDKDDTLNAFKRVEALREKSNELLNEADDILTELCSKAIERAHVPELVDLVVSLPPGSGWHKQQLREVIQNIKNPPKETQNV